MKLMFVDKTLTETDFGATVKTVLGKEYTLLMWETTKDIVNKIANGFEDSVKARQILMDKFNNPAKPLTLAVDAKGNMFTVTDNSLLSVVKQYCLMNDQEQFKLFLPRSNVFSTL
jgi:hypothetical protein